MYQHIPNFLTLFRIVITPFILYLVWLNTVFSAIFAFVLYFLAGYSDYLDGVLARKWNVESRFGAYWDPFADKMLVVGLFSILAYHFPKGIPFILVVVIILRDILATQLRNYAKKHNIDFTTSRIAKIKTSVQMFYLLFLLALLVAWHFWKPLFEPILNGIPVLIGTAAVAVLTIWSVIPYLNVLKTKSK